MWLFTKEAAIGIVRTVMPYVYAWLATKIPGVVGWFDQIGVDEAALIAPLGTVLYAAIRQVAEKIPQVGYLLVFNTRPDYSQAVGVGVPAPTDPPT